MEHLYARHCYFEDLAACLDAQVRATPLALVFAHFDPIHSDDLHIPALLIFRGKPPNQQYLVPIDHSPMAAPAPGEPIITDELALLVVKNLHEVTLLVLGNHASTDHHHAVTEQAH